MKAVLLPILLLFTSAARAASPSLELAVELDPGTHHLAVQADVAPASHDFRFELHETLEVSAATANGKPLTVRPAGRHGPIRAWQVTLPPTADKLHLEYAGTLPALDSKLDHRDVLQGLSPAASTDGSFLPSGGAWYPRPSALFAYRVTITVPGDQRALVPGRLQSEEMPSDGAGHGSGSGSDHYRARFEFAQPAEGIDLMAGPWVVREKMMARASAEPVRLRTYFFRDLDAIPDLADGYLDDTQRYLERYEQEIGTYPFTEFSVVASPLPTGFGMPTLTYLGADVLKLPFIRATSLGHEVLHNWWGNGVYVDYAHGNWSEGLTTFMADYAYKESESAEAARAMRLGWLRDFAAVPAGDQQSLADFRSRTHGAAAAVGYGKAAMLFVMLRDTIGEDAFRSGIRAFWQTQKFRAASWKDLQAAFERASGRSLDGFFRQWVDRPGGPAVKIAAADARRSAGGTRLTLTVAQNAPAYALHLPVQLVFPDREEMRWIDVEGERRAVAMDVGAMPTGVRLDPELQVWRMLGQEQLPPILRQWIIARAPRLALASAAPDVREAAATLAQRLFEVKPQAIALGDMTKGSEPVLLAGLHADVDAALKQAHLPPRPERLGGRGSAQVWTVSVPDGAPVAVVSARDVESLRALLRPLPHYGAQSWLVFEDARLVERGVWPAPAQLIPVRDAP
ncbi:M1 family metallopeptidase [Azoarcus sp. KH32C]|uniref:M1 family metallopeptidase n=1 Tax=Azoarcus sp. KH32C TaxID=748247 RepID=UPI0002385D96|nr:M1 family aminopeptidase [Azoarcus sp. KH32C]BAL27077.1 putative aminopeptidase [Azoarcus sp. KH32C]